MAPLSPGGRGGSEECLGGIPPDPDVSGLRPLDSRWGNMPSPLWVRVTMSDLRLKLGHPRAILPPCLRAALSSP